MTNNLFTQIAHQGRQINYNFPPLARLAKLFEEGGEFSETVMHKLGYLPHKTPKETPFGEAADVIICLIDTLASVYPELSPGWIAEALENHIEAKRKKWQQVVIEPQNAQVDLAYRKALQDTKDNWNLEV